MNIRTSVALAAGMLALLSLGSVAGGERMDAYQIGAHGQARITYPDWFKHSLLDLRDDLADARQAGKRGIIVFFSQANCNHCQAFLDTTLGDPATRKRVQESYEVINLDIFNDLEVTDIDGTAAPIRDLAEAKRARFTPTLLFYGIENKPLVKIVGFYPPETFNRVLDYIDGGHFRHVTLSGYLRAGTLKAEATGQSVRFDYALFARPPHRLERAKVAAARPLLVVFERPDCAACRRFRERVLSDPNVRALMARFDAVQLDAADGDSRLTVPDGRRLTPRRWAEELDLSYDVSVVFFDEHGREVHRSDAETGRDRMEGSMQYVLEKAYQRHQQFLRWRRENARKRQSAE